MIHRAPGGGDFWGMAVAAIALAACVGALVGLMVWALPLLP